MRRLVDDGYACTLSDAVISSNLATLPPREPVFVLADGQRALPSRLAERASVILHAELLNVGELVKGGEADEALEVQVRSRAACRQACRQAYMFTGHVRSPDEALEVQSHEWPTLEQAVCSQADTLLLSKFSPFSHVLRRRSREISRAASRPRAKLMHWSALARGMRT